MLLGESKDNWASLMTWAANHSMDMQRLRISTPITVHLVSLEMSCASVCQRCGSTCPSESTAANGMKLMVLAI